MANPEAQYSASVRDLLSTIGNARSQTALNTGAAKATARLQRGQIIGNTLASLGQLIPAYQQRQAQEQAGARQAEQATADLELTRARTAQLQQPVGPDPAERQKQLELLTLQLETGGGILSQANATNWHAIRALGAKVTDAEWPEEYPGDEWVAQNVGIARELLNKLKPPTEAGTGEFFERDPYKDIVNRATGAITTPAQSRPEVPKATPNPTEASLALEAAGGDPSKAFGMLNQPAPTNPAAEPLVPIMRDGKAILVPKSAAAYQQPASAAGGSGTEGAKLSAVAIEKVAGIEQSLTVLKSLEKLVNDDWLGPVAGRVTAAKINAPGFKVSDDLARFAAETATLKNSVVKAITGAAMSEPEAARIMKQIPDFADKPNVWRQKLAATRDNLTTLRNRTIELSGGTVQPTPTQAAPIRVGPYTVTVE